MKAKRAIGLLASAGILIGSVIGTGFMAAADSADTPGVAAVLQDFSALTDVSYDAGAGASDPIIKAGNYTAVDRIENADGTYSLGVKFAAGAGTANPSNIQIGLANAVPAETKAIAVRLTMPKGSDDPFTDGKTAFFRELFVDTPAGNYNQYLSHQWNGYYVNAGMYGPGYEASPVDCYKIDAATGEATKVTLSGTAQYEGYNFLDLDNFDGWVVLPLEYWMDESNYGDPLEAWATGGEGDIFYETIDPAKINAVTMNLSGNLAGYNPVYHEIVAVSDITAFVASFKEEEPVTPPVQNGKVVLQDFSGLTDISYDDDVNSYVYEPIFQGQNNGYYGSDAQWHLNNMERIENPDGTYSLGVQWNGTENWQTPSTVYVKFDTAVPAETKAIAVRLSLPGGTEESAQNGMSAYFPVLMANGLEGKFSPYVKHQWKGDNGAPGFENDNVTIYRIDTATGEKTEVTLKDPAGHGANLIFDGDAFEGWVVIPMEYWMDTTNLGVKLDGPNYAWLSEDTNVYGLLYEELLPERLNTILLGMGNSEDGYRSVYHEIAAITDMDAFMASFAGDVEITEQPKDAVVSSGDTATFSVTATAEGTITYQWQKSTGNGVWTDIEGANAATYTTPAVSSADQGTKFRCVMTTEYSALPTTTEEATLYVDRYPDQTINFEIGSDPIAAEVFEEAKGKNVNIIINVTDNGETAYTWKLNGQDITDAISFNPELEIMDIADIELDETAPDALYFKTLHTGKLPGKATLTLDTSFNFFEAEDLWLYSVNGSGKLALAADGMVSGVSTSEITLTAGGSYVLNNAQIDGAVVPVDPVDPPKDPVDTGVKEVAGLLAAALFGIALAAFLVSKRSVQAK